MVTIRRINPSEWKRARAHGLDLLSAAARYQEQDGVCAICMDPDAPTPLIVDHDHSHCNKATGCAKCVRSFLCSRCNARVGVLERNASSFDPLPYMAYIARWRKVISEN